ncbi:HNH endonuclease [Methanoregula sp.]|uniref:HNH endonuclease n=1 Tax=Methanoregula sp. TaxID=2052170 RepID=UPI003C75CDCB
MPPAAIRTIRDQIFWQYAKLIAKSAGLEGQRGFQMSRFVQLRDGKIIWSSTIREWVHEHEKADECIYCGIKGPLTTEHILPRSCGGPDIPDNAIRACRSCNSGKGGQEII